MTELWVTVLNVGLSAVLAFAGSWLGSYYASKRATHEVAEEEGLTGAE